jgi:O-antigen/teichoic acid export membrane protein
LFIGLFGGLFVFARRAAQAGAPLARLRHAALRYSMFTGLATVAIVCLLAVVALPADKRHLLLLCCIGACLLPTDHLRRLLLAIDQGSGNFQRYNVGQLVYASALPSLLTLAFVLNGVSLAGAVALTVAAPWIGLLACGVTSRDSRLAWFPAQPSLPVLFREGRSYWPSVVADDLFGRLDLLLVLWLASLPVQGYYAAAVPAAGLLCSATSAVALFSFNAGARRGAVSMLQTAQAAALVAAFQIGTALVLAVVIEPLVKIVYGSQFQPATGFALALLPANAVYGCSQVAEGYLRGRNRNRASVWSRCVGAGVMGVAVPALWPRMEVMAIPWGFAAGQAVVLVWLCAAVIADIRKGDVR